MYYKLKEVLVSLTIVNFYRKTKDNIPIDVETFEIVCNNVRIIIQDCTRRALCMTRQNYGRRKRMHKLVIIYGEKRLIIEPYILVLLPAVSLIRNLGHANWKLSLVAEFVNLMREMARL